MEQYMATEIVNDGYNFIADYCNIIENGTKEEFLSFAKTYNIFQVPRTKIYKEMCDKIKARLDREGLDYETVRPE